MLPYYSSSVTLVTGAASGIGRELAWQAAALGAEVWACDIDAAGLAATEQRIRAAGHRVQTFSLDVGDAKAIEAFVAEVTPQLQGQRLILINNAGVALTSGYFQDTSMEDMEWLFRINYWGPLRLMKGFYPYLLSQNRGHIVNLSSVFGLGGIARQSAYSPSKFALRGLTETLRMELVETQVRTTVVHPGGIDTNIVRNARISAHLAASKDTMVQEFARIARTSPQEAARVILAALPLGKQRVLVGADARLIDFLIRLLPQRYTRLFFWQTKKYFTSPDKLTAKQPS